MKIGKAEQMFLYILIKSARLLLNRFLFRHFVFPDYTIDCNIRVGNLLEEFLFSRKSYLDKFMKSF